MALGALQTLRRAGLEVPGRVSLIGFDDHEMAPAADLTTVAQPVHRQGELAARLLLEVLAGDAPNGGDVLLPTRLVVRGSTGPPAGAPWSTDSAFASVPVVVDLRSEPERRLRAAALLAGLLPDLRARARGRLGDLEGEAFARPAGAGAPRRGGAARPALRAPDRHRRARPRPGRRGARRGGGPAVAAAGARPAAGGRPGLVPAVPDGRLRLLRRPVRRHPGRRPGAAGLPGRARRDVPAPDAAAGAAGRARTTAATRSPTTTRSTRGWAPWPTWRSSPPTCTTAGSRCASTWCSTTPPASTSGPAGRPPATRRTATSTWSSRTGRCRTPTSGRCRRSSRTSRRAASPTSRRWAAGCGRRSTTTSGTWTTRTRPSSGRCSPRCCGWPTAASTCSGWTRRRSCGSGWAPTARTSRRRTCCCRRCGR